MRSTPSTVARVWLAAVVSSVGVAAAQPAAPAFDVPFEQSNNKIVISTTINGKGSYWFCFDTGSPASVIDSELAASLSLTMRREFAVRGAGEGSMRGAMCQDAMLGVGGARAGGPVALALPIMAHLAPVEGRAIQGLIGQALPDAYTVEIDYHAGRLRLFDPPTYSRAGSDIPIRRLGGHTVVRATMTLENGATIKGRFILDTGARIPLSLTTPVVNAHDALESTPTIEAIVGHGVGGELRHHVGRARAFEIGTRTIEHPVVMFSQDDAGVLASDEVAGIVGGELLRRFTLVLDYSRDRVLLEPNAEIGEPFEFDMSGLWLAAEGDDFTILRVRDVADGSPAREAGVLEGDRVMAIDGTPFAEWTLERVRERLKREGEASLEIERDGRTFTVALSLRRRV